MNLINEPIFIQTSNSQLFINVIIIIYNEIL